VYKRQTSNPNAFEVLGEKGLTVKHPELTCMVTDHVVPTDDQSRPFEDDEAELMAKTLEDNVEEYGINYFGIGSKEHGVCHVTFPEQGLIWPGMVVVCGDSHTCTYGAFGALAFGIGSTQVGHVLATQTLAMDKLKVRKVDFDGELDKMITAKDLALYTIKELGVKGGVGFAYEFSGEVVDGMSMEERMTLCNMAVEGGARSGYVNPDKKTFDYLRGRPFAPKEEYFEEAEKYWKSIASDVDAVYDDVVNVSVPIEPMVTWGVNPGQAIGISEKIPTLDCFSGRQRAEAEDALEYMGLKPGDELYGLSVDVVFIGSCTNGRLSDLEAAAEILKGRKVSVRTLVVPGSELVKYQAEEMGLDKIFIDAGAEWRYPGCSMCLAMNPDKVRGNDRCASTSNRNFKNRQGGEEDEARTHLMSPYTAVATAIEGKIADPRRYLR